MADDGPVVIQPNPRHCRGGHRATVAKIRAAAQTELEKADGGSRLTKGVLINKLAEKLAKISQLDDMILDSIDDENEKLTETIDHDNKMLEIEEAIANIQAFLKGDQLEEKDEHNGKRVQSFAKLPKLDIKPFSGDALEYPTFQQQFDASIGRSDLPIEASNCC
jgi:hypothetical protein